MPSLREVASSATDPTAPIEKRSTWSTANSLMVARLFPETPMPPSCINGCLVQLETAYRCRSGSRRYRPQSIDTIRRWIQAGAPDWTPIATPLRRFVPPSEVLKAIDAHVKTISPFERPFARYFTMTHLYNAGVPSDIIGEYRKALVKLVNSLSWGLDIVNPQPIDPQQTIFYIDLRHYEWDRNAGWTEVEEAYPYHIEFNSPAQTALRNQLSRLQTTLSTTVPSVNADWFIASAASPPHSTMPFFHYPRQTLSWKIALR